MDGNSHKNSSTAAIKTHGLRLIKGGSQDARQIDSSQSTATAKPSKRAVNPLLKQLNALAEAIDQDVAQILKL